MRILGLTLILAITWTSPLWAGDEVKDMFCADYRGYQVFWIKNRTIDKIAATGRTKEGVPIIRYNPDRLPNLSPHARKFALNYECAHHVLGYTLDALKEFGGLTDRIDRADCWAISRMFYSDRLNPSDVRTIEKVINGLSPEQWTHFPGGERTIDFEKTCPLKK